MRRLSLMLPLLFLAGCAGEGLAPLPTTQVRAAFPKGGLADVIVVDAVDRLPLRGAELVAADGSTVAAAAIDVGRSPDVAVGQAVVDNPWSRDLADGNGVAASGLPRPEAAALRSRQQLLMTVSKAEIALPDPVVYRRDWRNDRIRLFFGAPPGAVETREIAAPEPPPPG